MPDSGEYKLIVAIKVTGKEASNTDQHRSIITLITDALETELECQLVSVENQVGSVYDRRVNEFPVDNYMRLCVTLTNTTPFLVSFDSLSIAVELALMPYVDLRPSILSFHTDLSRRAEDVARRRDG